MLHLNVGLVAIVNLFGRPKAYGIATNGIVVNNVEKHAGVHDIYSYLIKTNFTY